MKPTEILVIANGYLPVIVPADKWPEELELPCMFKCEVENDMRCACECKNLIQKLEAIAQGAVVEYDVTQPDSYKSNYALAKIVPCDFDAAATLKNGTYPIDPSLWVVEKQWQYLGIKRNYWCEIDEKGAEILRANNPSATRQIATIKPKAGYKMPTDFSKVYVEPAPSPTRKLALDELERASLLALTNQAKELEKDMIVFEAMNARLRDDNEQLKSELSKANEKVTELYDANCIMGVELSDLREQSTEEKAKAFDEGAKSENRFFVHNEAYTNPYREATEGKHDLQKSTE